MDADRVGAYPSDATLSPSRRAQWTVADSPHRERRRRPPSFEEQRKREAWARWWNSISPKQRKK